MSVAEIAAAHAEGVHHRYARTIALDGVGLELPVGRCVGLIGPDGVGKSTLLGLLAGAKRIQAGRVLVLGGDMADPGHRAAVCPRLAYMPQGLGRNLYPDLSVRENVEFFARLFGTGPVERRERVADLLEATGLDPFPDRLAGKLSGGMRQKLGLCCALVHDPDLLILDEPTTGVDPLSRRRFWELIERLRARRPGLSVVVATAYMEEAERFDRLVALHAGRVLAAGTPGDLRRLTGGSTLEESFVALLPEAVRAGNATLRTRPRPVAGGEPAILARGLTRRFGDFTAVDGVSLEIGRGEIFGFLGSNGCGKTTTMRMLAGLLPASAGHMRLLGRPLDAADAAARRRVGYMSQSFSLYGELTVRQNLDLHARLFGLAAGESRTRVATLLRRFGLEDHAGREAASLPPGIRQRLSLAVAVVHGPELLILDEPTAGADPLARDRFWGLLAGLSRDQGVTIFISTHFMNEAARCDRVALMHAGRVLAIGIPAELTAARGAHGLEDAFIGYLEEATAPEGHRGPRPVPSAARSRAGEPRRRGPSAFSRRRLLAYAIRETLELARDRVRLAFALLGTAFLMLVMGFGINTDVDLVPFAALDRDRTPESRAYLEELRGSRYFAERPPTASAGELERRMRTGELKVAVEIPPGFGRDVRAGRRAEVGAWVDGAMPFRAETVRGYLDGLHRHYLADPARGALAAKPPVNLEVRFRYNQDFRSVRAMVPAIIGLLLALMPAILMALAVVREKELGPIGNLYVTPVTRLEFLLGKQLPYVGVAMLNFLCMVATAVLVFGVPLRGDFWTLALASVLYVTATTGYGLVVSAFCRTQIAAQFGTAILTVLPATQFSGMLAPVSSLSGAASVMGHAFPMTYYLRVSVGTFTKAIGFAELWPSLLALAAFIPVLTLLGLALLRKQER